MDDIHVEVALYGPVARAADGKHVARKQYRLNTGATMGDLLQKLGLKKEDTGYIFINAILCDVPGLFASRDLPLHEGDHIGIFSSVHMWPYQYRDGARMTDSLRKTLQEREPMRHSYASDLQEVDENNATPDTRGG
jgi:molybdopterin converting factor small subunit